MVASIIAGFGGIISEVGAVMLVGGNIEHQTRVLTTAIVLETRKGAFDLAIALGIVLLLAVLLLPMPESLRVVRGAALGTPPDPGVPATRHFSTSAPSLR